MRSPEALTTMFRARGLKMTPQRQAVFNALHRNDRHPTAEFIWSRVCEEMPTVSLKTVYQALNDLVELGEVQAVSIDSGAIRFDPNVSNHAHFVCQRCGRVYDVASSAPQLVSSRATRDGIDPQIDPQIDLHPSEHLVETSNVIFRGCCSSCR